MGAKTSTEGLDAPVDSRLDTQMPGQRDLFRLSWKMARTKLNGDPNTKVLDELCAINRSNIQETSNRLQ